MTGLPWLAYVPYTIARDILDHAGISPVGRENRSDAVAMFADVSGFTVISEALSQTGRAGTEELTRILNDYFETMIVLVREYGGIVGQFGGDALTVLFPYTSETQAATIQRAIRCGLAMQDAMDRYESIQTQVGTYKLSFKAGIAAGRMYCTTVGDLDVGLKSVVAGTAMDLCADAEKVAARGEVVIHDNLLPFAGKLKTERKAESFSHVVRLDEPVDSLPLPPLTSDLTADEQRLFAAYLHPVIAERLTRNQQGFINEHRSVTVLFVNFSSFDYDSDPDVGTKLQDYLGAVLRIVQRYDGYLNKVDMGDKGSKVIILFGAPVAHEDNDERALRCALELRALPGITTRIGINTGMAFCGLIGAEARQEYTVIGDAVNLSARLMQATQPGQIYVSRETRRRPSHEFLWTRLEPLAVKGKTDPIEVYTLDRERGRSIMQTQEFQYTLSMVGREAELAAAETAITRARTGQGQIIGITAEAGMGKTRLSAEVIRLAHKADFAGYGGECESFGTTASYLVWHNIWRTFFDIDTALLPDILLPMLEAQLTALDPALARRAPLLGPALNISLPDNDLTAGLDAKLRKSSLEALLVACVRARAAEQPLLILLEDVHWIDPLSFELLVALARNIVDVPVVLLLVYRPPELAHIDLSNIRRAPNFTELALAEFTPGEAETLIRLKLQRLLAESDTVPPQLVRLVTARAQGNPFYIDEMINLLQDQGIDPHDAAALETVDLPDSLHSLIISRIDRLLEDHKITLKVASVIGRIFRADWLWQVYPDIGDPYRVKQQLDALNTSDFLTPSGTAPAVTAVTIGPEMEYLFKHIVTQEVAYESLAVATRARLHERVAGFIETAYPDEIDQHLDLLAFHYAHSTNTAKQRVYFRRAGDAAAAAYANNAALDYYQRLIPLLDAPEQPESLRKLGKVWELTGKWDEADTSYRRALELSTQHDDVRGQAQAYNELGRLLISRGAFDEALDLLELAHSRFAELGDQQGISRALHNTGNAHLHQGDPAQAGTHYDRALQAAEEAGDQALAAALWGSSGLVQYFLGDVERALAYLERQVQLCTESGDRRGAATSRNNIGVIYENRGDYGRAMTNYRHFLNVTAEVGDRSAVGLAVGNIGILYYAQGEYAHALQCFTCQLEIGLEVGDWRVISFALSDMAEVFKQQEDHPTAEPLCQATVRLARALNMRLELGRYLYRTAELLAWQHRYAEALPLAGEARDVADSAGQQDIVLDAQLLALRVRHSSGTLSTVDAVAELKSWFGDWPADEQQADLHYTTWQIDPGQQTARAQAAELYRTLFSRTPNAQYARRYHALTGDTLPDPPALPPLSGVVAQCTSDRAALARRAAEAIAAMHDET